MRHKINIAIKGHRRSRTKPIIKYPHPLSYIELKDKAHKEEGKEWGIDLKRDHFRYPVKRASDNRAGYRLR